MNVQPAKRAIAVVLAVVGWALVYLTAAHSWAVLTARESVVGPAGFVAGEVVRIAPAL